MTEYQILYLRYLQLKAERPDLNHYGHEPEEVGVFNPLPPPPTAEIGFTMAYMERLMASGQRRLVEREFYRTIEREAELARAVNGGAPKEVEGTGDHNPS